MEPGRSFAHFSRSDPTQLLGRFLVIFLVLCIAPDVAEAQLWEEAYVNARRALDRGNCTAAIDTLESVIGRQSKPRKIRVRSRLMQYCPYYYLAKAHLMCIDTSTDNSEQRNHLEQAREQLEKSREDGFAARECDLQNLVDELEEIASRLEPPPPRRMIVTPPPPPLPRRAPEPPLPSPSPSRQPPEISRSSPPPRRGPLEPPQWLLPQPRRELSVEIGATLKISCVGGCDIFNDDQLKIDDDYLLLPSGEIASNNRTFHVRRTPGEIDEELRTIEQLMNNGDIIIKTEEAGEIPIVQLVALLIFQLDGETSALMDAAQIHFDQIVGLKSVRHQQRINELLKTLHKIISTSRI